MRVVMQGWARAMVVAAGVGAALAAGCTQPAGSSGTSEAMLPASPTTLADHGMAVQWQTEVPLAPGTHLTDVWVRGGYVVCHGSDHRVYAVDARTGVRLWSQDMAEPHETLWPPALYENDLWFATTTRLVGLRAADGRNIVQNALTPPEDLPRLPEAAAAGEAKPGEEAALGQATDVQRHVQAEIARIEQQQADLDALVATRKKSIALEFAPSGPPVTDGAHVFLPDAKGWLQAVSIRAGVIGWGRWLDDTITAGPVIDGTRVFFAGHNGIVYASAQNVRRILWQYQTEGPIIADLRITATGIVLVGSLDYSLYAFDGASGVLEWDQLPNRRYNAGEPIRKPPYTFGEQVFLFTPKAGLTVLDTVTGRPQWQLADGENLVTADADTVYVLSRSRRLLAVDRKNGSVRFDVPLRGGTLAGINETGTGLLYLATADGRLLAIAQATAEDKAKEEAEKAGKAP